MQEEVRLYHNAEARISYHLRKLGTKIGIKGKLTLYIARHSWATAARDNDVSISAPSKAQKWMMQTPRYWQPYEPQKRIKRGFSKNEPK